MKIAIYGAGSLGIVIGAMLNKNGIKTDLITSNTDNLKAIRENGANVCGEISLSVAVNAFSPEEMPNGYDIIFLLTKQLENEKNVMYIVDKLSQKGFICTLQNGIPELEIASIIGESRVVGGTVEWGAQVSSPGCSELTSNPESMSFSIGSLSRENHEKVNAVKNILSVIGKVNVSENFLGMRFSKVLFNASFCAASAIFGCDFQGTVKNKQSRFCVQQLVNECVRVARAANIIFEPVQGVRIDKLFGYENKIKQKISFLLLPVAIKDHKFHKASMLQDLNRGKKSEINSINGVISEYGKKYNVPTPYNDIAIKIVHSIEEGKLKSEFSNLQYFPIKKHL